MTAFVGMDVQRVRSIAQGLAAQAEVLDALMHQVDHAIGSVRAHGLWEGADFDDCENAWNDRHRGACLGVVDSFRSAAEQLRRQADQQDEVSGGGNGAPLASSVSRLALLDLAGAAYDQNRDNVPNPGGGDWTRVDDAELRELGIDPRTMVDPRTGFKAALFVDEDGTYVLSFAGTDFPQDMSVGSLRQGVLDMADDAGGGMVRSAQGEQALALATVLAASRIGGQLQFTGHSLGGRLAAMASIATGRPATTFNAAGVGDADFAAALRAGGRDDHAPALIAKTSVQLAAIARFGPLGAMQVLDAMGHIDPYAAERRQLEDQVTSVVTSHDPLTIAQEHSAALPDAVGERVELRTTNEVAAKGLIEPHNVSGIRPSLTARNDD